MEEEAILYLYEISILSLDDSILYYKLCASEKKILAFFSQVNPYEKEISKWFSNNLPALQSGFKPNQYEPWKHITHISQFESLDDFFIYFNLFMSQTFVWKNKTYSRVPLQLSLKIIKTTTFTRFLKTK